MSIVQCEAEQEREVKGKNWQQQEQIILVLAFACMTQGWNKEQSSQWVKISGDFLQEIQILFYLSESIWFTLKQDLCTLEVKTLKDQICDQILVEILRFQTQHCLKVYNICVHTHKHTLNSLMKKNVVYAF